MLRKRILFYISLISIVLLVAGCGPKATETPTTTETTTPPATTETTTPPATTEGPYISAEDVPRISIEELKSLVDSGADIVIVDCQPASVYSTLHITGAISIPWAMELSAADIAKLPDKDAQIITYCDCGPGEADSADTGAKLIRKGYTDVKVLIDPSIRGWEERAILWEDKKDK